MGQRLPLLLRAFEDTLDDSAEIMADPSTSSPQLQNQQEQSEEETVKESSGSPDELAMVAAAEAPPSEAATASAAAAAVGQFVEELEAAFIQAESLLSNSRFDLAAANQLLQVLRALRDQQTQQVGCTEKQVEMLMLLRLLQTLYALQDGVQLSQAEKYEPRQTLVLLFCVLAVFPSTLWLARDDERLVWKFGSKESYVCYYQLPILLKYCNLKTNIEEGPLQPENFLSHLQLLLDLALSLERERAHIAFLIASMGFQHAHAIALSTGKKNVQLINPRASDQVRRLYQCSTIIYASSLIRLGFIEDAKEADDDLRRVSRRYLPHRLKAKLTYVQAVLLQSGGYYSRALQLGQMALQQSEEREDITEISTLIQQLQDALEQEEEESLSERADRDEDWLRGTNVQIPQRSAKKQDEVRLRHQQHHQHSGKHRRPKRTSPESEASRSSSSGGRSDRSCTSSHSSSSTVSVVQSSFLATSSRESLVSSSGLDNDDSEDEGDVYQEREIYFVDFEEEVDDLDNEESEVPESHPVEIDCCEQNERSWFEESEQAIANGEAEEEQEADIHLSDRLISSLQKGGSGRAFYPDWPDNAEQLWQTNPNKYKRCVLKIERPHKSIAKVIDKDSKYSEIVIEGRSKAGRTYMDDEVVVEILAEPGHNKGLQLSKATSASATDQCVEKMAHGQVVGLLKRVNYAGVEHPVLFCTLDDFEGHLMKPLCKTVPKIHVMHDMVKKKFPALAKNRIEIKKITSNGEVVHDRFFNVQPDRREQYLFKVVILSWRQQTIYPLGAVLDAHIAGRDYDGGLRVLQMKHRVPKRYPRAAVENTKTLLQQTITRADRTDLTSERIFTIDPPGSLDLDDAVSIKQENSHYVVGVHIADVAALIEKDSAVDLEARRRAVTFYPLGRKPHAMLPEPLSHGECSLRCGQECLAFSVFFKFNKDGTQVEELEPAVKRTIIKSCRQLTYEEAQKVIDKDASIAVETSVQNDIRLLHMITSKLKRTRQKLSMLFVPFEDPRLCDLDILNDHIEAHSLIEELMILANSTIARRLSNSPRHRDVMLVRCHKAPSFEELAEWREKEGSVSSLVMQLQGKTVTPNSQLSLQHCSTVTANPIYQQHVVVQRDVWRKLCRHLEEGELAEARRLACMDALHPLQCLAASHWMDLMETAQYKCCYGLNRLDLRHFGLDLEVYTHFTSPIRRYADIHVQRLLHAYLDGKNLDCTPDFVTELCQQINSATSRQKAFGKGCMALKVAESLQKQPLVFRAFVESVDTEQLTLHLPSLLKVPDRRQEVPFSMLGVSCQPELTTDTALRQDSVTVQWNKRIYDVTGTCTGTLMSFWRHLERPGSRSSNVPVEMTISPDQHSVLVKHQDWVSILKMLVFNGQTDLDWAPQPVSRDRFEVDYMSSEKGDGTVSLRPVHFKRVYTSGQVLKVQLSAEPKKGLLIPRVEILHTACNASFCTQHVTDPVLTLTRFATVPTRDQNFRNYKEYVQAWMPLLEMEAAVEAGDGDGCVVIGNVTVSMKAQGPSNSLKYRGIFSLGGIFCFDRCIGFGGQSADSIRQDEFRSDNSFPLDYLCLRYKMNCPDSVRSRVRQSQVPEAVDGQFTWVAHASVVEVIHTNRKAEDGGHLMVTFVLSPSSPQPPPPLMSKNGARVTLEILPKSEVDRRCQQMLLVLEKEEDQELAHAIAYGTSIPKLDSAHKKLGKKDSNHEVIIPNHEMITPNFRLLPWNNPPQLEAIKMALTHSLTIIQGPPGSGKTNVGIKLVYLFCKINRQLEAEGKGKKTVLYCGPSNKSVDLVARELKSKLGPECPKMVRVYGSAIESKDYPVPRGDLRSTRGMRDLKCDPDLQDVALHHLIRQDGKPYAHQISVFERHFDKCHREPEKYSVTNKQLKKYRELLYKASVQELKHYQVVLATCAVGGNRKLVEGTEKSIFQVIIDECAMSPEAQSMVPIIATQAKQVVLIGDHKQLRPIIKCQPAAELGLDQSLFERLYRKFETHTIFLSTQYRMHPEICRFPSKEFYEGKLKTGYSSFWGGELLPFWPTHPQFPEKQVPHLLINVLGEEETLTVTTDEGNERSKSNSLEAEKVLEIITFLKREFKVELPKVKVLTQYNAQRHLLENKLTQLVEQNKEVFERYDKSKFNVSTVVSSQGGEWDYVILSTVRSLPSYKIEPNPTFGWCRQNLGFITDQNQVNVALTRARRGLFIIGNVDLLKCDNVWNHLVQRYERLGCYIADASLFPPPPRPRIYRRKRHVQPNASDDWRQVSR